MGGSRLLTVEESADVLRCSKSQIYNWRLKGEFLPGFRIGKRVLFDESDLEAWIESRRERVRTRGER